jgi:hypothetical protein
MESSKSMPNSDQLGQIATKLALKMRPYWKYHHKRLNRSSLGSNLAVFDIVRAYWASNADKNLIKMPGSRRLNSAGSDVGGDWRTELQDPAADRFIADIDPAFGQHFLDVPKA